MKFTLVFSLLLFGINTQLFSNTTTGLRNNKDSGYTLNTDGIAIGKSAVYIEILGRAGGYYTLNYMLVLKKYRTCAFSSSLGYGYFPAIDIWKPMYQIPISINFIKGTQKHFLESSLGLNYIANAPQVESNIEGDISTGSTLAGMLHLGYRFQPKSRGFFIGIGATAYKGIASYGKLGDMDLVVVPGLSVGFAWGR